jgi:hypothetical protein
MDQYQLLCCLALLNSVSKSIFLVLEDNSLTTLSMIIDAVVCPDLAYYLFEPKYNL